MTRRKMRLLCYHAPSQRFTRTKNAGTRITSEEPATAVIRGFLEEGLVLRTAYWRIVQALLMGVSLTAQSAEGVGRDPFDTERFVPKTPGEMWLPSSALPQVP